MNDKAEKKVIEYVSPITEPSDYDVVTHIGEAKGASVKFGVTFPVFVNAAGQVDAEKMQARYNMSILELVQSGVRQLSTRPNYDSAFTSDGCDQNKLQEIADKYVPGSRISAGPKATPEKAKVARKLAKAAPDNMSASEEAAVMEFLAKLKAQRANA